MDKAVWHLKAQGLDEDRHSSVFGVTASKMGMKSKARTCMALYIQSRDTARLE